MILPMGHFLTNKFYLNIDDNHDYVLQLGMKDPSSCMLRRTYILLQIPSLQTYDYVQLILINYSYVQFTSLTGVLSG